MCMCVCVCFCICVYLRVLCVFVLVCVFCVFGRVYISERLCASVSVHVCLRVSISVYDCMCVASVLVCLRICMFDPACACVSLCVYVCVRLCVLVYVSVCMYIYVCSLHLCLGKLIKDAAGAIFGVTYAADLLFLNYICAAGENVFTMFPKHA